MMKTIRSGVAGLSLLAATVATSAVPAQASPPVDAAVDSTARPAQTAPLSRHFHPRASDPRALRLAWHTWKDLRERGYNLRVDRRCFCPAAPAVVTKVRHGVVVRVFYANARHHELARRGWTMDRLFFLLRHAYEQADRVDATFGRRGVPTAIAVDYDSHTIDEEVSYVNSLWQPPRPLARR